MDRRDIIQSVVLGAAVLGGVLAYVDLKVELAELRGRMDATGATAMGPAPSLRDAPTSAGAAAPTGPAGPQDVARDDPEAIAADPWACTGHLGPEMVQTAVGRHGRDVFTCHELHPGSAESARHIRLELRVGPDGKVTEARLQGDQHPAFAACLRDKVRDWRFAPPIGGECAIVSAPFRLGPAAQGDGRNEDAR